MCRASACAHAAPCMSLRRILAAACLAEHAAPCGGAQGSCMHSAAPASKRCTEALGQHACASALSHSLAELHGSTGGTTCCELALQVAAVRAQFGRPGAAPCASHTSTCWVGGHRCRQHDSTQTDRGVVCTCCGRRHRQAHGQCEAAAVMQPQLHMHMHCRALVQLVYAWGLNIQLRRNSLFTAGAGRRLQEGSASMACMQAEAGQVSAAASKTSFIPTNCNLHTSTHIPQHAA